MGEERPSGRPFPWRWALPSAVLLVGNALWGVVRYPDLPARLPQHIGTGGIDAWTDKSVGAAFALVFVYAGASLLVIGSAYAALRVLPEDELRARQTAAVGGFRVAGSLVNRPASAASAARIARAMLVLNAGMGVMFTVSNAVWWRGTETPDVPGWMLPGMLGALALALVPVIVTAVQDHKEKRALK